MQVAWVKLKKVERKKLLKSHKPYVRTIFKLIEDTWSIQRFVCSRRICGVLLVWPSFHLTWVLQTTLFFYQKEKTALFLISK